MSNYTPSPGQLKYFEEMAQQVSAQYARPCPFCKQPLASRGGYFACLNKACSFPLGYSPISNPSPQSTPKGGV